MTRLRWWLVVLVASCGETAFPMSQAPAVQRAASPSGSAEPASTGAPECRVDDDCELVPIVTCCGECKPAPPFESVPRSAIDTLLLETEERCLRDDRPCPVCARPPRGCTAAPRCAQGTCTFTATGCDFPNT